MKTTAKHFSIKRESIGKKAFVCKKREKASKWIGKRFTEDTSRIGKTLKIHGADEPTEIWVNGKKMEDTSLAIVDGTVAVHVPFS